MMMHAVVRSSARVPALSDCGRAGGACGRAHRSRSRDQLGLTAGTELHAQVNSVALIA